MRLGLALAGGGIKGIAHAGVLQALEENKIDIDVIGGTSSGSLVASLYAIGYSPKEILEIFKKHSKKIIGINSNRLINGIGNYIFKKNININGINTGEELEKLYNYLANKKEVNNMKDIKNIPIVIPTVDILTSKKYICTNFIPSNNNNNTKYITDITLGKAVRASSSFPAMFAPCIFKNHLFSDGGTLDNVPVLEIKKYNIDKIIAVDFSVEEIDENSNIIDIAMKNMGIMINQITKENLNTSDIVIMIKLDKIGLFDTKNIEKCFNIGYAETIKNIDKIKELTVKKVC